MLKKDFSQPAARGQMNLSTFINHLSTNMLKSKTVGKGVDGEQITFPYQESYHVSQPDEEIKGMRHNLIKLPSYNRSCMNSFLLLRRRLYTMTSDIHSA